MSLFSNVLTVGGVTLASRLLGFLRDTLIAAVLGTGAVADAFVVAFRLPNLFRRLFAEGAFTAAFVPLFVRLRGQAGAATAHRFAGEALAGLVAVVGTLTLAAIVFAAPLVDLLAPGFAADPAKRDLAILLARICFPYLVCISVVAMLSGLLTADRRFTAPALAPVVLNLVLIAALSGFAIAGPLDPALAGTLLSIAVGVGGLAQVALLVVTVVRAGSLPPRAAPCLSPEIRRLLRLGLPGVVAGAIGEINVVVATVIASSTAGAVSWLYYADRLYQLPLGVVGIAIGQVLLPEIALRLRGGDPGAVHDVQNRALEFALALALPAALALVLLAEPIVTVLFERGAFGPADRLAASHALSILALGLPAQVLVRVFSPGFFAREDTRTPMAIGVAAIAVNLAIALALSPIVGWSAVAIASTVAAWVQAGLLFGLALAAGHWRLDRPLARRLPRLLLAALAMAAVVHLAHGTLAAALDATRPLPIRGGALALLIGLGLALYAGLVLALRVVDPAALRRFAAPARPLDDTDPSCRRHEDRA